MKKYIKSILAISIVGLSIIFSQTGCKEHTIINSSFAPGINNINIINDSFTVLAKTKYYDSVITSYAVQYIYMGAGVAQDPTIGKTNDGIYFQLIQGLVGVVYTNYTIDSAFLILPYSGFTYGDNSNQSVTQSLAIYGVADPTFSVDSSYYAFNTLTRGPFYGSGSANMYHLKDSVSVGGLNVHPHMRINIGANSTLVNNLIAASNASPDFPTFLTNFHGLYVEATDTNNALSHTIPYFQLDGDGSDNYEQANVLLYAHTNGVIPNDAQQFTFYFSAQYCAHFNKVTHIYTPLAKSYFQSTTTSDAEVLLENGPGAVIDVKIPGISRLILPDPSTGIVKQPIINQAQLVFTISQPSSTYQPPVTTYPYSVLTVGGYDVLSEVADRYPITSTSPLGFINGTRDTSATNTIYTINVPRELQLALSNKLDTLHLRINGSSDYWGAFRAIIAGGNYSDATKKMKFNVVYSKLR